MTDWPHQLWSTAAMARILLTGGPFDGEEVGSVPSGVAPPAQIVWGGWFPQGFSACLYQWYGERTMTQGRTDALVYRPTGRQLGPEKIPPALGDAAETWADAADLIIRGLDVPAELIWPGL